MEKSGGRKFIPKSLKLSVWGGGGLPKGGKTSTHARRRRLQGVKIPLKGKDAEWVRKKKPTLKKKKNNKNYNKKTKKKAGKNVFLGSTSFLHLSQHNEECKPTKRKKLGEGRSDQLPQKKTQADITYVSGRKGGGEEKNGV